MYSVFWAFGSQVRDRWDPEVFVKLVCWVYSFWYTTGASNSTQNEWRDLIGWRWCHSLHLLCHISVRTTICIPHYFFSKRECLWTDHPISVSNTSTTSIVGESRWQFPCREKVPSAAEEPTKNDADGSRRWSSGGGKIAGMCSDVNETPVLRFFLEYDLREHRWSLFRYTWAIGMSCR